MAEAMPPLMAMLGGAGPALTGIGIQALAPPEQKIEVEMTVRLPDEVAARLHRRPADPVARGDGPSATVLA